MSAPQNLPKGLHQSGHIAMLDPGNAGTITVDRTPAIVNLISAAAETRTLARPTRSGITVMLSVQTYVGNITVTVTGNYDTNGDSVFTLTAAGQFVVFESGYDGTNHYWRKISDYAIGNMDATAASNIAGLTATAAELNRTAQNSTREVLAGATLAVTAALHDGRTIAMPAACAVTLPAATGSGARYRFYQKIAATAVTITATAGDMYGVQFSLSDDAGAPAKAYNAAGATVITFDGSTKGGIKGAIVEIEDVAASLLLVSVRTAASGTEASCFS